MTEVCTFVSKTQWDLDFASVASNGVGYDNKWVFEQLCEFLQGK